MSGTATSVEQLESMLREGRISPDEYARLREALTQRPGEMRFAPDRRRLRKSWSDRELGGVCGGIAHYFDVSSTRIRLLFLLLLLCTGGTAVLVYLVLSLALPWDEADREQVAKARYRMVAALLVLLFIVPTVYFLVRYLALIDAF